MDKKLKNLDCNLLENAHVRIEKSRTANVSYNRMSRLIVHPVETRYACDLIEIFQFSVRRLLSLSQSKNNSRIVRDFIRLAPFARVQ